MKTPPHILTLSLSLVALAFIGCQPIDQPSQSTGKPGQSVSKQPRDNQMLTLPNSDQGGPWPIGAYSNSNPPIRGVDLTRHIPKKHSFIGLAVSEQNGLAIATFRDDTVRGKYDTYALTIDLTRGRVQTKWSVPDFAEPISINSDGTKVLFWRNDGVVSGRELLYVGQRKSTAEDFELSHWQPFKKAGTKLGDYSKSTRLKWASFVGQRVVTVNEEGQLLVFGGADGKGLKWISDVEGFPTLTPDQKKVVFVAKRNVLLFDPSELAITHALKVDEIPEHPILSVDPHANNLLIAGTGKATMVQLDDLTCRHVQIEKLATENQRTKPDLAWFGNSLFFYNDRLFDFDSPMPVWMFRSTDQLHLVGESMWGITRSGGIGSPSWKLQRFSLNANSIVSEIREAYRTSDVVPFRKGDSVQIDVSQLPSAHQATARAALQQSLEKSGYVVANAASVRAVATLGELVDRDVTYQYGGQSQTFDYRRQNAKLSIEKDGQRLWGQSKTHSPPGTILKNRLENKTVVAKWGTPDYSVYASKIPTFMRSPRSNGYLGYTVLGRSNSKLSQARRSLKARSASSSRTGTNATHSGGPHKEVVNPFIK